MRKHTQLPKPSNDELTDKQLDEVSGGQITKRTDSASPKFFQNCVAGAHYQTVVLSV
jgi:bacteriocin-like protein